MAEELFTEEDTNDIAPAEVAEFLASSTQEEEAPGTIPEDIRKLLQENEDKDTDLVDARVEIAPDKTFEENKRDVFDNMFVHVRDIDIPITDEDKLLYMKCLLTSNPITLEISIRNGLSAKCRSLSVYEGDVAVGALTHYLTKNPGTPLGFHDSLLQQYRIAMQLTEYCNRPLEYLSYARGEGGTYEDHVLDLFEKSQRVLDVPGPVFGIYVRMINVFQYKLGKLHEAAFNSDFWSPVGSD